MIPRPAATLRHLRAHCLISLVASCPFTVALATLTQVSPALAQADDRARQEARERFDRGLNLFNTGDTSGALAEFQRTYEVTQHPVVLFNIGLVYQAMRQPVQAAAAFTKLLANPGQLDAERLTRARSLLAEQQSLIGFIQIISEHANATVEIDNVQVATTPLTQPLAVPTGNHVISLILPGYYPLRQQLTVASKETVQFRPELRPLEGRLAHLEIKSSLADVSVLVNGELLGKTPLPASLALAPGQHTLGFKRDGYSPQQQTINLGDGASGSISIELSIDAATLGANSGFLELELTETQAVIFVDGRPLGTYTKALQIPKGSHRLRVERANFFPYERIVDVPSGSAVKLRIELQPTTEYRASYVEQANTQNRWGWVSVGAGALFVAGGTGFLIWNGSEESSAQDKFDTLAARGKCIDQPNVSQDACVTELTLALKHLEDAQARTKFGWIGVGVGAVAAGFGTYLLLSNADPNRYEPKADSDVFGRWQATPTAWVTPDAWGLGLSGRF